MEAWLTYSWGFGLTNSSNNASRQKFLREMANSLGIYFKEGKTAGELTVSIGRGLTQRPISFVADLLSNAAALPALYDGISLSSQLLDLVKSKYFFLQTSINRLQQGIVNLRNAPISESDIASLEPQILSLNDRLRNVLSRPELLDRIRLSQSSSLIGGLANLREILPASQSAFNAKFRSLGAYGMITQVLSEINQLISAIGARL
ncbi:hypothetical protein V3C99_004153 [Haemonchus contortus]|uniref:Mce4_CUP1 domain-containing protein n=1 Tax=Haemonchus contortus TaxID=6289 RepID=A0A7I4XZ90_HAECO|nr:unnamed protein product [Haemonchus contortus]